VTLYIGKSHKTTHGLKDRVTQNFTINDTGGTFRKNLAQRVFNNDETEALNYIKENIFLQFIVLDPIIYTESQIDILEQIAIALFAPQCNLKV